MKRQKYTVCACNMFSQVIYCSSAQNSEESSAGACSFCGFHALRRLADRMLASHWPSRNYCTVLYIILKYSTSSIIRTSFIRHSIIRPLGQIIIYDITMKCYFTQFCSRLVNCHCNLTKLLCTKTDSELFQ